MEWVEGSRPRLPEPVCERRFLAMIRKRAHSLLLRLRYLKLLAEIEVLISMSGIRRDLDFRIAKPQSPLVGERFLTL
jgi:hypothetical protein